MQQQYGGAPPAPQYVPPAPVPAPTSQGSGLSKALSILAVILSVVALVINFAIPGPAGAQGATGLKGDTGDTGDQGIQGPAGTNGVNGVNGKGTIMASSNTSSSVPIGSAATNYDGAEVTITVPGPGTVVVYASVMVDISHTSGSRDLVFVNIDDTGTTCLDDAFLGILSVSTNLPSDTYWINIPLIRPFNVSSSGTYTYHITARMVSGQDAGDQLWYASVVAVFHPT